MTDHLSELREAASQVNFVDVARNNWDALLDVVERAEQYAHGRCSLDALRAALSRLNEEKE